MTGLKRAWRADSSPRGSGFRGAAFVLIALCFSLVVHPAVARAANWSAQLVYMGHVFQSVAYGNEKFVAVGYSGYEDHGVFWISPNGQIWANQSLYDAFIPPFRYLRKRTVRRGGKRRTNCDFD